MDMNVSEALNVVEQLARQHKVLVNAAEVLAYMAGLEQRERELKESLAKLDAKRADAEADLEKAMQAADATRQKADADARATVDNANTEAAMVIAEARGTATRLTDEIDTYVKEAQAAGDKSTEEGLEAIKRRDAALLEAEAAEARVATAKAEIQRMLSGG